MFAASITMRRSRNAGSFFTSTGRRIIMLMRHRPLDMIADRETRAYALDRMRQQRVEIVADASERAAQIIAKAAGRHIEIPSDFVVHALGKRPSAGMAASLRVEIDTKDAVVADERMRASAPAFTPTGGALPIGGGATAL